MTLRHLTRTGPLRAGRSLLLGVAAALLGSCGGGGGSSGPEAPVLQGTAAVGKPIADGRLALHCAAGDRSASTGSDGRYQVALEGLTLPCLLTVSGGRVDGAASGWVLVSAVTAGGVANVTPWTHLVVARTLMADPDALDTPPTSAEMQAAFAAGRLEAAKLMVGGELARLLGAAPSADLDAIGTAFSATTGNGMDTLLVQLVNGLRWTAKTLSQAAQEIVAGRLQVKEVPGTCRPAVLSGFAGGFDDVPVQVPYDPLGNPGDSTGGSGDGGGAGGGDGAGAGGSLGQFLNALVRVERVDGSLLGQAETDATKGLVTIVPCRYQGPVLVTVRGKADGSTRYYEESVRAYAPFPAGTVLHAALPSVTRNAGVTILTEAAWQYMIARPGWGGTEAWKTAAHVGEASEVIRTEFNRLLPAALQVQDITRLPVLLNDRSASGSIDTSENGKYGIVNAGLARAAGLLLAGDSGAALKLAQQLGADLCDGVLDYKCYDLSVIAAGDQPAYLLSQWSSTINIGIGDVASNCGTSTAEAASFRIVQFKVDTTSLGISDPTRYTDQSPIFLMRNDGKVFFWSTRSRAPVAYEPTLTFRQLFAQGPLLGVTLDGRAFRAPLVVADATLPLDQRYAAALPAVEVKEYAGVNSLAEVDDTFSSQFAMISRFADGRAWVETAGSGFRRGSATAVPVDSGLGNIARLGVARGGAGSPGYFAVSTDGALFSWGDNAAGQLGLGKTYDELGRQPTPALVPFPSATRLVSVSGRMFGAFAIDKDGEVWGWGGSFVEGLSQPASTTPRKLTTFDATKPIRQIECAAFWQCAALSAGGDLVAWGYFASAPYGATRVPLPAGRKATFIGAAGLMVYGLLDDGTLVLFPGAPSAPYTVLPSFLPPKDDASCNGPR